MASCQPAYSRSAGRPTLSFRRTPLRELGTRPCPHSPDAYILVTAQDPGQCSLKPGGGTAGHILWEGREKISLHLGGAAKTMLLCCGIKAVLSRVLCMPKALLCSRRSQRQEGNRLMRPRKRLNLEEAHQDQCGRGSQNIELSRGLKASEVAAYLG